MFVAKGSNPKFVNQDFTTIDVFFCTFLHQPLPILKNCQIISETPKRSRRKLFNITDNLHILQNTLRKNIDGNFSLSTVIFSIKSKLPKGFQSLEYVRSHNKMKKKLKIEIDDEWKKFSVRSDKNNFQLL